MTTAQHDAGASSARSDRANHRAPDERALIERALSGDREAFGALYERHHRAILRYARSRTEEWAEAEDVTSAVWLDAWKLRARLCDVERFPAWLFGLAKMELRRGRFRPLPALSLDELCEDGRCVRVQVAAPASPPAQVAAARLRSARRVLDSLTAQQRQALLLHAEGRSARQIAPEMELNRRTFDRLLERATTRAQALLAQVGGEVEPTRDRAYMARVRAEAYGMFAADRSRAEVARALRVSPAPVSRWYIAWAREAGRSGQPSTPTTPAVDRVLVVLSLLDAAGDAPVPTARIRAVLDDLNPRTVHKALQALARDGRIVRVNPRPTAWIGPVPALWRLPERAETTANDQRAA